MYIQVWVVAQAQPSPMAEPRYLLIKNTLRERIERGALRPGDRVPSENQLVAEFGVSRMTARRAVLELADSGLLQRAQGVGTFVADARSVSSITQVRDIAEEVAMRGGRHACRVLRHEAVGLDARRAMQLGVRVGDEAFHSVVVHLQDGVPIQHERRWVHPAMAPDYLQQDLRATTPSAYLFSIAPLTEAEQSVEAVLADADVAAALQIARTQPCLLIRRRTFSGERAMSLAELMHPGDRYRLGSHVHNPTSRDEP